MNSLRTAVLFLLVALSFPFRTSTQTLSEDTLPFGDEAVLSLPYSAMRETQEITTLPDGTQVVHERESRQYRDSTGRMRLETFASGQKPAQSTPELVVILDPAQHVFYRLRPATHIGYYATVGTLAPAVLPPPNNPDDVDQYTARLRRPRYSTTTTSENLGKRIVEGFLATGQRTTNTISAGQNERPRVVVDEVWITNGFDLPIVEKHFDSRLGQVVSRVTNLSRSEPDPAIFRVPPDYSLKNVSRMPRRIEKPVDELVRED